MKLGASHVTVIKLSDSAETEGLRGIEVGAVMKMSVVSLRGPWPCLVRYWAERLYTVA